MINGDRLRQVRELSGLTQTGLAKRLGISQSTIAYIERDRLQPSEDLIESISVQTGFPIPYFHQESTGEFPQGSLLLFRARMSLTARDLARAHRLAQTLFECAQKI